MKIKIAIFLVALAGLVGHYDKINFPASNVETLPKLRFVRYEKNDTFERQRQEYNDSTSKNDKEHLDRTLGNVKTDFRKEGVEARDAKIKRLTQEVETYKKLIETHKKH